MSVASFGVCPELSPLSSMLVAGDTDSRTVTFFALRCLRKIYAGIATWKSEHPRKTQTWEDGLAHSEYSVN